MAKTHELKTLPIYFDAVLRGDKTFEIRENDRDFQTGDTLILREFDPKLVRMSPPWPVGARPPMSDDTPDHDGFTGREAEIVVTYMLHGGKFGLAEGTVVLALHETVKLRDAN